MNEENENQDDENEDLDQDLFDILDLDNLDELMSEGLEARRPKRDMHQNSLNNLNRGNVPNGAINDKKLEEREKLIEERRKQLGDIGNLMDYYKEILVTNLIKEELNVKDLQEKLLKSSNAEADKIIKRIQMTMENILRIGEALKVQSKQQQNIRENNPATMAQSLEELRKNQDPQTATSPDLMRKKLEELKRQQRADLESGENK